MALMFYIKSLHNNGRFVVLGSTVSLWIALSKQKVEHPGHYKWHFWAEEWDRIPLSIKGLLWGFNRHIQMLSTG